MSATAAAATATPAAEGPVFQCVPARALYDFPSSRSQQEGLKARLPALARSPFQNGGGGNLLAFKRGDLIEILPCEERALQTGWMLGRCVRTEREGFFPGTFVLSELGASRVEMIDRMQADKRPPLFIFRAYSDPQDRYLVPCADAWDSSKPPLTPPPVPGQVAEKAVGRDVPMSAKEEEERLREETRNLSPSLLAKTRGEAESDQVPSIQVVSGMDAPSQDAATGEGVGADGSGTRATSLEPAHTTRPLPNLYLSAEEQEVRLDVLKLKRRLLALALDKAMRESTSADDIGQLSLAQRFLRNPALVSQVLDVDTRTADGLQELVDSLARKEAEEIRDRQQSSSMRRSVSQGAERPSTPGMYGNTLLPVAAGRRSQSSQRSSRYGPSMSQSSSRLPDPRISTLTSDLPTAGSLDFARGSFFFTGANEDLKPRDRDLGVGAWAPPRTYDQTAKGWFSKRRGGCVRVSRHSSLLAMRVEAGLFSSTVLADGQMPRVQGGKWAVVEIPKVRHGTRGKHGLGIGVTLCPPSRFSGQYLSGYEVPNSWSVGYGAHFVVSGGQGKQRWLGAADGVKWDSSPDKGAIREGDRVGSVRIGILVTAEPPGDLVLFHNGKQRLRLAAEIPVGRPLFLFVDVTGNADSVQLVPSAAPSKVPLKPRDVSKCPLVEEYWGFCY